MASVSDNELEYLSPSFDPSSLTVPRLRSILLAHDIHHPASAKKPQLIELFNQELLPRSRKILAARSRIRRTSKGIKNIPSSQSSNTDGDDGGRAGSMPPPPIPDIPKRTPRRDSRQHLEDSNAEYTKSRTAGKSSSKHARQSDTEISEMDIRRPTVRKTRRSDVATTVKTEEPGNKPAQSHLEKSPFSDENPFQSGSSPLAPTESRRKSAGLNINRSKSVSRRRKPEDAVGATRSREIQQDGIAVPSSKTFSMPVANYGRSWHQERLEIEAGEDFTPEEQLDLSREQIENGKVDILPPRQRNRSNRGNSFPRSAPWLIILALLSGYALWFRQEKIEIGYCGTNRASHIISNYQMPDWASFLQPECEPCPQHAFCYEDMEARCEPDFVLKPHPLSIGGLIPLPPICEPDGEKAQRVKAVADRAIEALRERKAGSECGTLMDEQRKVIRSPEIDEQELKREVASKRRKGMSEREFDDLWKGALGEIAGREEVVQFQDGLTHHIRFASNSLARIPFGCGLRRSFRLALARYRIELAALSIIIYLGLYTRNRVLTRSSDAARTPSLVSITLDRLITQAALYHRGDAPESWISIGQLRDDILRDEFSATRRESMWKEVRKVVEMNANVRASERELRAGDMSRVWEWIGNLGLRDEGWEDGGGRRSGVRFSLAGSRRDSSPMPNGQGREETMEKRQWNEGRPIY